MEEKLLSLFHVKVLCCIENEKLIMLIFFYFKRYYSHKILKSYQF